MGKVISFPQDNEIGDYAPGETAVMVDIVEFAMHLRDSKAASPGGDVLIRLLSGVMAANKDKLSSDAYITLVGVAAQLFRSSGMMFPVIN